MVLGYFIFRFKSLYGFRLFPQNAKPLDSRGLSRVLLVKDPIVFSDLKG